jgi:hypothetical protein
VAIHVNGVIGPPGWTGTVSGVMTFTINGTNDGAPLWAVGAFSVSGPMLTMAYALVDLIFTEPGWSVMSGASASRGASTPWSRSVTVDFSRFAPFEDVSIYGYCYTTSGPTASASLNAAVV